MSRRPLLFSVLSFVAVAASAMLCADDGEWRIAIDPDTVVQKVNLADLLGSNAGLWYSPEQLERIANTNHELVKSWGPGLIRIPGGSWSDEIYWNGNGVRNGKDFDQSKLQDGFWEINYSEYRPGFRVVNGGWLSEFHGNIDVKAAHEFVQDIGAAALVTVNAGSGSPEMAAEWCKWAKKQGYAVRYWEVGNELEGQWEVGHQLPDGGTMTADIYAKRFIEVAKAIKAVDPEAKVGGPAASNDAIVFDDALLEQAGDLVDFISYHTYPVGGGETDTAKIFKRADSVQGGIEKWRARIREKVPERADEIEIGITEWHVAVHEGANTVNEICGPWSAKWIGRMIESGVDFANVWDFLSQTHDGGHGIFGRDEALTPRGAYWAMQLWGREMGGTMVQTDTEGGEGLTAFTTQRDDGGLSVLVVNESADDTASVRFNLGGVEMKGSVLAFELSTANYLWDDHRKQPVWSEPLIERIAETDEEGKYSVPPLSATVFQIGKQARATSSDADETANPEPGFVGPDAQPQDVPFSGWVTLRDPESGKPYTGAAQTVTVTTNGPLVVEGEKTMTVRRAAHNIVVTPTGSGKAEIVVTTAAGAESRHSVELQDVSITPKVLWRFSSDAELEGMRSSFQLSHAIDNQFRKGVAAIDVSQFADSADGKGDRNRLLEVKSLPEFERQHIGGFTFRLRASADFDPDAPGAKITAVLLSNANHWMPLGSVPAADVGEKWSEHSFKINNPEWFSAMAELYSVILLFQSEGEVKGSLFLDDLGFLLRK